MMCRTDRGNELVRIYSHGDDQYLALLSKRNTPDKSELSPVQKLMNRRTKTLLPIKTDLLQPKMINKEYIIEQRKLAKHQQKVYYDRNAKDLRPLHKGESVHVKPLVQYKRVWNKAKIVDRLDERSYMMETDKGIQMRRNRVHLRLSSTESTTVPPDASESTTVRRTSRETRKPRYMQDFVV